MVKNSQIDVEPKHLTLVKKILKRHITYKTVWAYGSRVNWTANQYSDLDLVVFEVNTVKQGELKEDLAESDLPFSVDVMPWEKIPEKFKHKILEKYVILQKKPELEGWNEGTLSDVAEVIMGQSPKGESCNTNGNGKPLLNGPTEFGVKNPHPLQFTEDPKKLCNKNDILFCVRGSTTGRMNWADQQYAIGRGIAAIRHKEGDGYKHFVRGIIDFNLPGLLASATGSTFPNVSRDQLEDLVILIPTPSEQKAIASVLSSLDDKIDLLHRQNKTLETMAETLFRQWFVEEAKKDWEEVELEYVSQKITDGAHQSPQTTEDGMPMASVKDMHQWGINYNTCRKISKLDYQKLVRDDCRPLKNDILIAKDGSYLKHIFVIPEDMDLVILSSIAIIRPNGKYNPILLSILLKLDSTKVLLENIVTGAVIPRIVLKDFCKFKILLPPVSVQNKALESIESFVLKCWQNISQINTLEKLRNTLLPKLMSGEVGVEYGN